MNIIIRYINIYKQLVFSFIDLSIDG